MNSPSPVSKDDDDVKLEGEVEKRRDAVDEKSERKRSGLFIHTNRRRLSLARLSLQTKSLPAYLIYVTEDGAQQRFDLIKPIYTIGRREDRDIVLQCSQISKDHASIEKTDIGYLIRDHDSVNGVLINERLVETLQYLKEGDLIQLGSVLLQFHDEVDLVGDEIGATANHHALSPLLLNAAPSIGNLSGLGSSVPPSIAAIIPPVAPARSSKTVVRRDVWKTSVTPSNASAALDEQQPDVTSPFNIITPPTPIASNRSISMNAPSRLSVLSRQSSQESRVSASSSVIGGATLLPPRFSARTSSSNSSISNRQNRYRKSIGRYSMAQHSLLSGISDVTSNADQNHLSQLVTILPSDKRYEDTITVRAELKNDSDSQDFNPVAEITDIELLRNDYEKLRLAFELSRLGLTEIDELLEKTLDLMFSVLPVNRGVIMLVDRRTNMLTTNKVKMREGKGFENREILLSSTILQKVFTTQSCLITSDAFEDPLLGQAASVARGRIRSVICVPMIAHGQVLGIMHLDSQDRINAFAEKDLGLVKAISNQTAIALENCKLLQEIEREVSIRENLGRFLPPHVVDRVIDEGEEPIRKGGRQTHGTILFADIRGFTQMSENSSPQEVVELLNDFFERMVQIVFKYDGILDKYIGDCLMAAFGTLPNQQPGAELNAVRAALAFKEAVADMNRQREAEGKPTISIGVGLNSGSLVAGFIGSSQRLEYTCIGDTVNTASRVCNMASEDQVLITEHTNALLREYGERVETRFVAKKLFKGKSQEIGVFEVIKGN